MCPPSPVPEVVIADTMPKPTQRELQKMHLQELVREEAAVPQTSKASREGKSQRELQRKELESLLESPTHEKQKEAKMKSLEAKIAEMQVLTGFDLLLDLLVNPLTQAENATWFPKCHQRIL
ncbi:unnamed protein product [Cladocopium goreaui]|uniref:Uncharacterized protein n=1 Tax=Cladocopium goreaui TaxID=2562237 RepID=A0A9P1D9Z1_9DINO|nr:unnamed protein product [Cladocopium goreaui]